MDSSGYRIKQKSNVTAVVHRLVTAAVTANMIVGENTRPEYPNTLINNNSTLPLLNKCVCLYLDQYDHEYRAETENLNNAIMFVRRVE